MIWSNALDFRCRLLSIFVDVDDLADIVSINLVGWIEKLDDVSNRKLERRLGGRLDGHGKKRKEKEKTNSIKYSISKAEIMKRILIDVPYHII